MFSFKAFIAPILAVSILVVSPTVTVLASGIDSGYASAPEQARCKLCKEDCFILQDAKYEACREGLEWWQIPDLAWCWILRHDGREVCKMLNGCHYAGEDRCDIEQVIQDEVVR